MDKEKKMMQFCTSSVKDAPDSEDHSLKSAPALPALSTRGAKSEPGCFCGESGHCSEDGWIVDWDLYSFCVFESLDYLRHYRRLNCAKKRGTDVFQNESQREPQVSPGDVENDNCKDTEEPDQPSPTLTREKGLDLETCDGGDCPDEDSASDNPRCQGCWAWLQRAFGQKKKRKGHLESLWSPRAQKPGNACN